MAPLLAITLALFAARALAVTRIADYAAGVRHHQPPPVRVAPAGSDVPTTRYPPQPPTLTASGLHDPIGSVTGLIARLLGAAYVPAFQLEVIPKNESSGNDVFELDYNASTRGVIIRGSAGYAIAAGLNWYLKYTTNSSISWGRGGSGNHIAVPSPDALLPPARTRMSSSLRFSYAYNVCTYGYSMAHWSLTQFYEEIDRYVPDASAGSLHGQKVGVRCHAGARASRTPSTTSPLARSPSGSRCGA